MGRCSLGVFRIGMRFKMFTGGCAAISYLGHSSLFAYKERVQLQRFEARGKHNSSIGPLPCRDISMLLCCYIRVRS